MFCCKGRRLALIHHQPGALVVAVVNGTSVSVLVATEWLHNTFVAVDTWMRICVSANSMLYIDCQRCFCGAFNWLDRMFSFLTSYVATDIQQIIQK